MTRCLPAPHQDGVGAARLRNEPSGRGCHRRNVVTVEVARCTEDGQCLTDPCKSTKGERLK